MSETYVEVQILGWYPDGDAVWDWRVMTTAESVSEAASLMAAYRHACPSTFFRFGW